MFKTVKELAQVPQRSVSLKEMVQYGIKPNISSLFLGSHFLLNELPLRLAHRVVELQNLPLSLSDMPSIQLVRNWYLTSFQELVNFKEKLPQRDLAIVNYYNHNSDFDLNMARSFNSSFVDVIERIKTRHDPTMTAVGLFF
jgi:pyruvate dehydrogenase kinase 2/3/4